MKCKICNEELKSENIIKFGNTFKVVGINYYCPSMEHNFEIEKRN